MKARVRFRTQPFFTSLPNRLMCPGMLEGRAEGRAMWTMCFTATKQLSDVEFEGDLRWLVSPIEQDFGRGVRFKLMSRPGSKRRLDGVEHDLPKEHSARPGKLGFDHGPVGKGKNQAAHAARVDKEEKERVKPVPPPDHGHHHKPDLDQPNPHLPLLRNRNFGTRPPSDGVFAEGELLG